MALTTISSIIIVVILTISSVAKASNTVAKASNTVANASDTVDGVRTPVPGYKIAIRNDYKPGGRSIALFVLCWRDWMQQGDRVVSIGETYVTWTYVDPNESTVSKCFVQELWDGATVKGKSRFIIVFTARTDQVKCVKEMTCYYSVREDGFYFSDDNISWSFVYPWKDTSLNG